MNNLKFVFVIFLVVAGIIVFLFIKAENKQTNQQVNENSAQIEDCTPTFAGGGGPNYIPNTPFRENIAPQSNEGEKLIVSGQILERDCITPVSNAVLDIWQANESGNYEDEWYRGRVEANENGEYRFETVVPRGYGEGTGYRPPHIHFKVFKNDRELITSQMFFPETRGREGFDDAYIMQVETNQNSNQTIHEGQHDIILP